MKFLLFVSLLIINFKLIMSQDCNCMGSYDSTQQKWVYMIGKVAVIDSTNICKTDTSSCPLIGTELKQTTTNCKVYNPYYFHSDSKTVTQIADPEASKATFNSGLDGLINSYKNNKGISDVVCCENNKWCSETSVTKECECYQFPSSNLKGVVTISESQQFCSCGTIQTPLIGKVVRLMGKGSHPCNGVSANYYLNGDLITQIPPLNKRSSEPGLNGRLTRILDSKNEERTVCCQDNMAQANLCGEVINDMTFSDINSVTFNQCMKEAGTFRLENMIGILYAVDPNLRKVINDFSKDMLTIGNYDKTLLTTPDFLYYANGPNVDKITVTCSQVKTLLSLIYAKLMPKSDGWETTRNILKTTSIATDVGLGIGSEFSDPVKIAKDQTKSFFDFMNVVVDILEKNSDKAKIAASIFFNYAKERTKRNSDKSCNAFMREMVTLAKRSAYSNSQCWPDVKSVIETFVVLHNTNFETTMGSNSEDFKPKNPDSKPNNPKFRQLSSDGLKNRIKNLLSYN